MFYTRRALICALFIWPYQINLYLCVIKVDEPYLARALHYIMSNCLYIMKYIRLSSLKVGDKFTRLGADMPGVFTFLGSGDILRFKILSPSGIESEIHGDIRVKKINI